MTDPDTGPSEQQPIDPSMQEAAQRKVQEMVAVIEDRLRAALSSRATASPTLTPEFIASLEHTANQAIQSALAECGGLPVSIEVTATAPDKLSFRIRGLASLEEEE